MIPNRKSIAFRHLEFLPLTEKRILLIIVTSDGNVQNRIIVADRPYTPSELTQATNFFNQHYAGSTFEQVHKKLHDDLRQMQSDMTRPMAAALEASNKAPEKERDNVVISGEQERKSTRLNSST